ncbi:fatty acid-binding protein DegV [Williamsoniiplasma somnilux]|uniref:Fatty acid-binding protein DegV n=1 Tax=Williamsoniiplasma somnilux TaxID=215578 RepID=A0A2K8NXM4_9MOLU|nr:DegV family protein [Williamsoniiplasma somnilux]ATZ18570.1 fatty acid-binding protein DegV [Williamsoniiplasma somnilux]
MKIAILTDSSYDGKEKDYKDLYVIPLMISKQNSEQIYDDGNLSKDAFYEMLDGEALKTSQTLPGDMMKMWDKLLSEYDQVIFSPISKGLSGQFNTYRMLSETEEAYKGKIFVADTNGVSVVAQQQIRNIAMWIAENKTGFEILELAKLHSQKFVAFIVPKTVETLKRGGRIGSSAAALAKMLKIVPILRYDGEIEKEQVARTFKKAILESIAFLKKECKGIKKIDLSYSRTPDETITFVKSLIEKEGLKINIESELTNVICAHTGRETIALVGWKG